MRSSAEGILCVVAPARSRNTIFAHLVARCGQAATSAAIPTKATEPTNTGCSKHWLAVGSRRGTPKGVLRPARCDAGATHEGP